MAKLSFTIFASCKQTLCSYSQDAKVVNENFIICNGQWWMDNTLTQIVKRTIDNMLSSCMPFNYEIKAC